MSDMLKELGLHDDENYIYLDKYGNAQKRVELTVHWDPVPLTKILVTCNSSDSLSYLRYLVGEVMEKYSNFSGLTSLQANKLVNNKTILPETGFIGEYVKSGDHLVCDLTAQDLWLNVKIEADKIGLVIFFEIKVYRNSLISGLKQSLVDIANQLFASRMNTVTYVEDECEVMKIDLNCKEHILTTDTKPMLDQSTETSERTEKLDNKILIGDVFDFLDRYLLLRLEKKVEDLREKSITMPSCTVSDSLIQISSTMPIRNLRVEPQVLNRNRNPQQTTNSDNTEQKNCHCYLL